MADDSASAQLLAELWDLVEEWSSTAIQRAREAAAGGTTELADLEIRVLVTHAAELRGVIEGHLERADASADVPADALGEAEATGAPVAPDATPEGTAPAHPCNSADFDRPPCPACGGHHWYCSICGAQRDECAAS